MRPISIFAGFGLISLVVYGCGSNSPTSNGSPAQVSLSTPAVINPAVQAENQAFLSQKTYDPWILTTTDPDRTVDIYAPNKGTGYVLNRLGQIKMQIKPGNYSGGKIDHPSPQLSPQTVKTPFSQTLNLETGDVDIDNGGENISIPSALPWKSFWTKSDIIIGGDPEAQQITHANMYYLAGSAMIGGENSIPPMGYSSPVYDGHIFWDAETWMFPALIVQHPSLAKGIIDYRFKHLGDAKALAQIHGYDGAEYPWESADTGQEEAPPEFAKERHITADIACAAWQYYLWTGDKIYLSGEAWPIIQANAEYWLSRVKKQSDGKYHILQVIGPDETAGVVDDDAWTNAIVAETLHQTTLAAQELGNTVDPQWNAVAGSMALKVDPTLDVYMESASANSHLQAKQADTQMLIYPLNLPMPIKTASNTLDYYLQHTMTVGPAMTSSIDSIIAARLGRAQQSLDLFQSSYRPFMRGPWDAFSEKRTKDNVYFCTGMGGCLQTVLYGFAGLNIATSGKLGVGTLIAKSGNTSLYADPHLPPGWSGLTIKGVQFHGKGYNVTIAMGNKVTIQ